MNLDIDLTGKLPRILVVGHLAIAAVGWFACTANNNIGPDGGNPTGPGSATLTWDKPQHNVDGSRFENPRGYEIHYGQQPGGPYPLRILIGDVTTANVTGLERGRTYYFVVQAVNLADNKSAYSNEASKAIE